MSSTSCRWRWGLECCCSVASGSGSGGLRPLLQSRPDRRRAPPRRQGTGGVSVQVARILSAYIARQFFTWFAGVFGTMVAVTFLLDYLELLRRAGGRAQAGWGVLLEMAALKMPHTAQEVMPFAILFGTMLAFWRLTRSNELVVARASGVSVWQFLTPAVLVALLAGVIAVTVFNPIASTMEASYEKLESRILRQSADPLTLSIGGLWLPTKLTTAKIEESLASPDTMSFWDLPGFITLLEQSGFSAERHRLHFNVLLARPFLFCAMVLVAATFSLRMQRRGGATLMIVSGVGAGFLLYFLSDIVFALGLAAKIPVLLAAWTPTAVSLIFGTSMLLHLEDG